MEENDCEESEKICGSHSFIHVVFLSCSCPPRKSRTSNPSISHSAGSPCCYLRSSSCRTSSGSGTPCFLTRTDSTSSSWSAAPCSCELFILCCCRLAALTPLTLQVNDCFLLTCCVHRLIRESLLAGDFTVNMRSLQVRLFRNHRKTSKP